MKVITRCMPTPSSCVVGRSLSCSAMGSWRRYRVCTRAAGPAATLTQGRLVHERPFMEVPPSSSATEAYGTARDALLQLNLMVRRGIEPDALMYTSLISTMGRAGLEWQAYKLFSRMIEQGVRPLPETYVALRDATSKRRGRLRDLIQTKIQESVETFPEQLAAAERERQLEEDRLCLSKFEEFLKGELPPLHSRPSLESSNEGHETQREGSDAPEECPAEASESPSSTDDASGGTSPVAIMKIRNPTDVWMTAKWAEELRKQPGLKASGEAKESLRAQLNKLDEEELRIYLSANRQLRHGNKEALVARVLDTVQERAIRAMLERRSHYFRSVESLLAADLQVLRSDAPDESISTPSEHAVSKDRTLKPDDAARIAPEILHTPWGILRKPMRLSSAHPSSKSAERLERVRLTEAELLFIRQKTETNDLDELPESLLRRYAFQFNLRWRRQVPSSLMEAVQWHALSFFPADLLERGQAMQLLSPSPTTALRLQKESEGVHKTLENFEAFRIVSQLTNNLQVVDRKEINLHLKRTQREAVKREKKAEESLRREEHLLQAAGLASSAKTFDIPPPEEKSESMVLGWTSGNPLSSEQPRLEERSTTLATTDASGEDGAAATEAIAAEDELPPWELFGGEDEFNLSTGHFGSPDMGRIQELSDSKFRVLPSREAQKSWSVDRKLLPSTLQDIVKEAELEQQQRHESIEAEYESKLKYTKFRRWDRMISRANDKKKQQRSLEEENVVQPLPPRRRMAQMLRKGRDKSRISSSLRDKYNTSL